MRTTPVSKTARRLAIVLLLLGVVMMAAAVIMPMISGLNNGLFVWLSFISLVLSSCTLLLAIYNKGF